MEEGEVVLITQRRQTRDGTDVDDSTDRDGYALRGNKLSPPGLRRNRTSRSCSTARTRRRERYVHFIDDKRGGHSDSRTAKQGREGLARFIIYV